MKIMSVEIIGIHEEAILTYQNTPLRRKLVPEKGSSFQSRPTLRALESFCHPNANKCVHPKAWNGVIRAIRSRNEQIEK